jgi:hypothetical protein
MLADRLSGAVQTRARYQASRAAAAATASEPAQGVAGPMTVISPLRPFLAWRYPGGSQWVRIMLRVTRIPDTRRVPRRRKPLWLVRNLRSALGQLGVIHAAHFTLIDRFADHGQPPEELGQHLLLFESNYDGGFDDYIDAFSACVPRWMKAFWGTSYGFPGPRPVTPFKAYIRANEFGADHQYFAHAGASTRMITSALAFQRMHARFREEADRLPPDEFEARYHALLASSQAAR